MMMVVSSVAGGGSFHISEFVTDQIWTFHCLQRRHTYVQKWHPSMRYLIQRIMVSGISLQDTHFRQKISME